MSKPPLSPEAVLKLLGIEIFERSGRYMFCCPLHDDNDPSAGFYKDTELAFCYSCEYTYDPVQFYAACNEMRRAEAVRTLSKDFFIPEAPKQRYDPMLYAVEKARCESLLEEAKTLPMKEHAKLCEMVDKIFLAYERGQLDDLGLDKLLPMWYNKVGGNPHAGPELRRMAETRADARLEEGRRNVSRDGAEGSEPAVGEAQAGDSAELASSEESSGTVGTAGSSGVDESSGEVDLM